MLLPGTDLKARAASLSSREQGFRYYFLRIAAFAGPSCTIIGKLRFLSCLGSLLTDHDSTDD